MADKNICITWTVAHVLGAAKRIGLSAQEATRIFAASRLRLFRSPFVSAFTIVAFAFGNANAEEPAGLIIGGNRPPPPITVGRCVDIEIDGSRAFHCLNEELRQQVDKVAPGLPQPPIDARSPDPQTGVVNLPGVREQYGKNFGVSAFPYRPPTPTFTSPIFGR